MPKKNDFRERVLKIVAKIPKGKMMTYGEVARKAGNARAARGVGAIMKSNHDKKIPCHRVVRTDGGLGGYNGLRGRSKQSLLTAERKK